MKYKHVHRSRNRSVESLASFSPMDSSKALDEEERTQVETMDGVFVDHKEVGLSKSCEGRIFEMETDGESSDDMETEEELDMETCPICPDVDMDEDEEDDVVDEMEISNQACTYRTNIISRISVVRVVRAYYTSVDVEVHSAGGWVPDLTKEGTVEPNPGEDRAPRGGGARGARGGGRRNDNNNRQAAPARRLDANNNNRARGGGNQGRRARNPVGAPVAQQIAAQIADLDDQIQGARDAAADLRQAEAEAVVDDRRGEIPDPPPRPITERDLANMLEAPIPAPHPDVEENDIKERNRQRLQNFTIDHRRYVDISAILVWAWRLLGVLIGLYLITLFCDFFEIGPFGESTLLNRLCYAVSRYLTLKYYPTLIKWIFIITWLAGLFRGWFAVRQHVSVLRFLTSEERDLRPDVLNMKTINRLDPILAEVVTIKTAGIWLFFPDLGIDYFYNISASVSLPYVEDREGNRITYELPLYTRRVDVVSMEILSQMANARLMRTDAEYKVTKLRLSDFVASHQGDNVNRYLLTPEDSHIAQITAELGLLHWDSLRAKRSLWLKE